MKGELDKSYIEYDGEIPEKYTVPDSFLPPPHNQGVDKRCASFAVSGILTGLTGLEFSESFIYGAYRNADFRDIEGMTASQLIPAFINGGACLKEDMPDLKDARDCYDYVKAHIELIEKAKVYARLFQGYVNLKGGNKTKTLENIKKAFMRYPTALLYGENSYHAVIFCGFNGEYIRYRDSDGTDELKEMHIKRVKEAYLFVPEESRAPENACIFGAQIAGGNCYALTEARAETEEQLFQQNGELREQVGIERSDCDVTIIETNFKWNGTLKKRLTTKYIVLHHRAGDGDVSSIHSTHLLKGWTGIGYNFYVRKDGRIYRGRPIDTVGAHTENYNSVSVGICFEGNYEKEAAMPQLQLKAGQELIKYLKGQYPSAEILGHRDLGATACPGKNFPMDKIKNIANEREENEMTSEEKVKFNEMVKIVSGIKEKEKIFNKLDEVPTWAKPTIQKLMNKGSLTGDENGNLNLDTNMLRMLVINDREGLYR